MATIKLRVKEFFNGRPAGHVKAYPIEVAAGLLKAKLAEETDDDETGDDLLSWQGERPGDAEVERLSKVDEDNEKLRQRIAELEVKAEQEKPKRGRPPKPDVE